MLLLDRIREQAHRMSRKGRRPVGRHEAEMFTSLFSCSCYELSNVVQLFDDWERDRVKPIPNRAPDVVTWCEWKYTENDILPSGKTVVREWIIGTLITEVTGKSLHAHLNAVSAMDGVPAVAWKDKLSGDEICYLAQPFKMLLAGETSIGSKPYYEPFRGYPENLFAFKQTGEYVGCSWQFPQRMLKYDTKPTEDELRSFSFCDLPILVSVMKNKTDQHHTYWPPFMAFALMHCKNIDVLDHEQSPTERRRVERSGNPPRVTYKTLSIKVPETLKPRVNDSIEGTEENAGVRFHLCRGHFKNLQHSRYKSPGLHWWPAHWRGDPDMGVVIAEREVVSK